MEFERGIFFLIIKLLLYNLYLMYVYDEISEEDEDYEEKRDEILFDEYGLNSNEATDSEKEELYNELGR